MGFSHAYGPALPQNEVVARIRLAFDLGYSFFDTAECYTGFDAAGAPVANESPVGEALRPIREQVILATKCGVQHLPGRQQRLDSRPESIRRAVEGSLRRLGVDYIDLYYQHRIDPAVEPELVAATMAELIREGKIRAWGISEVGEAYLRRAHAVCPVAAVQNCYSMVERGDEAFFPVLEELGIAYVSYSPLANGLLSTHFELPYTGPLDHRSFMRQFQPEGQEACRGLLLFLQELARDKEATPAQIALAWMLCKKPYIIPIPGTRREARLRENFGATRVQLTPQELAAIDSRLNAMDFSAIGGTPARSSSAG